MTIVPITFDEACSFIQQHHRHHKPPRGYKYTIGCEFGGHIVGVVVVGRPVSRKRQDGWTLEVTRLCTNGTPHVASKLYAAAWRVARELGYRRLITFILKTEPGTSLRAAGWRLVGETSGKTWSQPSRPRVDKHPLQERLRFEKTVS